ncbi:hypothetical protein [Clostridium hydrogeniformans]|uniref:hypothetical protein n=1 Tax=Clostridium hydrogeniformans TaxID=349933 RepID=UPI000AB69E6E|nr:hypothetical protein [Clostridium hydrogeniformans]
MVIRLFIRILLKNKDSFIKPIKLNGEVYVINIEKYESSDMYMKGLEGKVL